MQSKDLILHWPGHGFGNALIVAHVTEICIDNGINAVFYEHKAVRGLVDVPIYVEDVHQKYQWYKTKITNYLTSKNCDESVVVQYIKDISKLIGRKINIHKDHNYVPVRYYDMPGIPMVDVVLCTQTGSWTPYRNWPHFDELKQFLDKDHISYVDLHKIKSFGIKCLNYVRNARLYIGLDTGMSHYVSQCANGKSLIIHGGFNPFNFVFGHYDYDCIRVDVPCPYRPCFINKKDIKNGIMCEYDNSCIANISADMVFEKIRERLKDG